MSLRPVYRVMTENYTEVCVLPMPSEGGVQFTPERIWSQNAGRSSSTGKFVGDVICVKYTVTLTYDKLTEDQVQPLLQLTDTPTAFWRLEFPRNGNTRNIECYIAPPTYTVKRWNPELEIYEYMDVVLEFIQR